MKGDQTLFARQDGVEAMRSVVDPIIRRWAETTVQDLPNYDSGTWGPEKAKNMVKRPAEDFCLVVVQRRHVADTNLVITGEIAQGWMSIAQVYAGPPTEGRNPGMFPKSE